MPDSKSSDPATEARVPEDRAVEVDAVRLYMSAIRVGTLLQMSDSWWRIDCDTEIMRIAEIINKSPVLSKDGKIVHGLDEVRRYFDEDFEAYSILDEMINQPLREKLEESSEEFEETRNDPRWRPLIDVWEKEVEEEIAKGEFAPYCDWFLSDPEIQEQEYEWLRWLTGRPDIKRLSREQQNKVIENTTYLGKLLFALGVDARRYYPQSVLKDGNWVFLWGEGKNEIPLLDFDHVCQCICVERNQDWNSLERVFKRQSARFIQEARQIPLSKQEPRRASDATEQGNIFRKEASKIWTLSYEGKPAPPLPHVKGLDYEEEEPTQSSEVLPAEPYTPLELQILEALKGNALTRREILVEIGREGQYEQSLDRVLSPKSRLRQERLIDHKPGVGYYRPDYPPKGPE